MYTGSQPEKKSKDISLHFTQLARRYRDLRITDHEPIIYITRKLDSMSNLPHIDVADIGCGDGRYSLLLAQHLDGKVRLRCVDNNEHMLERLEAYLATDDVGRFVCVKSDAESLPFGDNSFDCILTFNAVHHFKLTDFLVEVARILRGGGLLFIYTRTPEQNRRNIWGRYFPQFCQKETRLYHQDELEQVVGGVNSLRLHGTKCFKYERVVSLEHLMEKAANRHYSTLWYYSDSEFNKALDGFKQNLTENFADLDQVRWFDENLLLVVKKEG